MLLRPAPVARSQNPPAALWLAARRWLAWTLPLAMVCWAGTGLAASKSPGKSKDLWYDVSLNKSHAGYANVSTKPLPGGKFSVNFALLISLSRAGIPIDLSVTGKGVATSQDVQDLTAFESLEGTGLMSRQPVTFTVKGVNGGLHVEYSLAGGPLQAVDVPADSPLLADSKVSERLDFRTAKPGDSATISMGQDMNVTLAYVRDETLSPLGKPIRCAVMESRYTGLENMTSVVWVDKATEDLVRLETGGGPMSFTLELSTPERAKRAADTPEVFLQTLQPVSDKVPPAKTLASVTYELTSQGTEPLSAPPALPGRQSTRKQGESLMVTVTRKPLPARFNRTDLKTGGVGEFLKPSGVIQSDAPEIVRQAREISRDHTDLIPVIAGLRDWVNKNVVSTMNVGFGTAAEVMDTRQGDCSEHSVLLAAMLRASGVPARVCSGYVYAPELGSMGGHMWTEVYLDGWYPLDATLPFEEIDPLYLCMGLSAMDDLTRSDAAIAFMKSSALFLNAKVNVSSWTLRGKS